MSADFDEAKIDEVVLALLHLNASTDKGITRAWKSFDWDAMNRLHDRGLISDPRSKAKSVMLTEEGEELARQMFDKYFLNTQLGWIEKGAAMDWSDEQAILIETEAFAAAWNGGDAKAAASFFTEDGVRVGAFGDIQHGRAEIEAAYDRLLHQTMPGASVKQERGSVRILSPDLAIWQGGLEIVPPVGSPLRGHVVQVMRKVGERWLTLEGHPKIFPPPPGN